MSEYEDDDLIMSPVDSPEWQLWSVQIAQIIARAWVDEGFKRDFVMRPAAVLREHGLDVPEDLEVSVKEGATTWSLSGSGLAAATRYEIPLPPKPDADQLLAAWAEGEAGHPPILGDDGQVAFAGIPEIPYGEPGSVATARRISARRISARRIAARRVIDDDFDDDMMAAAPASARRVAARRVTARRVSARRVQEEGSEDAESTTTSSQNQADKEQED